LWVPSLCISGREVLPPPHMAGATEEAKRPEEEAKATGGYGGEATAGAPPAGAAPGAVPMTVKVPEGAKAGDLVYFTSADGQQLSAPVPEGKSPGDEFTVLVLPAAASAPPTKAKVTVPEGVKPGEKIVFPGPFGYDMEAVVPEGKQPGDQFYVMLGPPKEPPRNAEPSSYTIKVPEDRKSGDEVFFTTTSGQQMRAIIPEGKGPGDSFEVHLGPSQVMVTVPEGKGEGEEVEFEGPGGVRMKAKIPKGKKAGEQFAVSLVNDPALSKGLPAFCNACSHGDLQECQKLKREGQIDVNGLFDQGFTPLFYAATSGHFEVAKWLLEEKADLHATNESKRTPLHWAARNGHTKVVELLIDAKAEMNGCDGTGRNPLALALQNKHDEAVEALRKAGAQEPEKK